MRFKSYVNETITKTEYVENAIVQIWNDDEIKSKKSLEWIDTAKKVVDFLKLNGVSGKALDIGRQKQPITELWKKYKSKVSKDTPKTDIIIGDKKISIKVETTQFLASAKDETMATFYTVIKKNNYDDILLKELTERISKFSKGRSVGGTNPNKTTNPVILEIDKYHKETQNYIKSLFVDNKDFIIDLIHEAITGQIKFGKDSIASADWMLTFSKNGDTIKFENMNNKLFLNSIINDISVSVRFKSNSYKAKKALEGERNFWTVLMMVHKFKIDEGVSSFIKNIILKIKKLFKNRIDKIFKFIDLEPIVKIN